MFAYCVSAAVSRSRFRGASQAPALRVTSSAHGCGRRTCTSRSRLRSFNRCAARLAPRAERSAWSWTSTLEIHPDLENDEIAGWRRRGHRDADARRGARMLSRSLGASAPPRHSLLHGGIHSTVEWNRAVYRHLGVTRFEHHRDPGRVRRGGCERGLILGFGLWRGLMLDRLPVLGQPAPHALDQLPRILAFLFRVLEIRQVLEKVPQRLLPQRAREFLPASGLSLVAPAERRKRGNPQIGE